MPVAMLRNGKAYSILTDHLGTPTEAYDDQGNEVWTRTLDLNGKVLEETGNIGMIPFLFQGQYYDKEIGLAYNRYRYYNPETGAYISQDPIGLNAGILNLYGYVFDTCWEVDQFGLSIYRKKNGKFGKKPGPKSTKKKALQYKRRKGVKKAWEAERELLLAGKEGTRRWSDKEKEELIATGKVSGYIGHHINCVDKYPKLADNPDNIEFVTHKEHYDRHNGNYHNKTHGDLLDRTI